MKFFTMHSNSSEFDSNLKSHSDRQADASSADDPRLRPLFLPLLLGALAVLVQSRLCHKAGLELSWHVIVPFVSGLALVLGGMSIRQIKMLPFGIGAQSGRILLVVGAMAGFAAGVPFGLWTVGAALLVLLSGAFLYRWPLLDDFAHAILVASLFLGTATALGGISAGGYTAAFAFFFFLAWSSSIAVEHWKADLQNRRLTLATLFGHTAALVTAGILFFIFGIITTWPYLNEFYSSIYFWIIVIGVDLPLLYMWGKLKVRKPSESDIEEMIEGKDLSPRERGQVEEELWTAARKRAELALAKFNDRVRWLIFVVLVALLLS
jgi:hypothetical protein